MGQHLLQSFVLGNHFYVSREEAANTPSRLDGVSLAVERSLRARACELMQEASILLKLPQNVYSTGTVLLHRFYSRVSVTRHRPELYAKAALYLGSKVEEDIRKMREFLAVFQNMHQRSKGEPLTYFDVQSAAYADAKAELTKAERKMLLELGFLTHIEHPHKFITSFLNFLSLQKDQQLMQLAWSLMNDSMRTNLCVQLKPEAIACGCIYMAAQKLQRPMPSAPPWWRVFDVQASDIDFVVAETLALYS